MLVGEDDLNWSFTLRSVIVMRIDSYLVQKVVLRSELLTVNLLDCCNACMTYCFNDGSLL